MPQGTLSLVIAPRRQIARDLRANSKPIVIVSVALILYIVISSAGISLLESWSFLHAAYFTVINVTTVGFGDVTAATQFGKLLSGINAFAGLLAFGVLVALITMALQPSELIGTATPTGVDPSPERTAEPLADRPETAITDLLGSLNAVLRNKDGLVEGPIRIAVHGDRRCEAYVFVEIVIDRGADVLDVKR